MDCHELYNESHPNIWAPRKCSLFHSQNFKHTLTHHEFKDNVLVAVSLFLLGTLLKDIITRIVYMRPRFSPDHDNITYFSQARIVLLDNSYLLRWVRKFQLFDDGHYTQRNHMQYNLVMLATLAMFIAEMVLIVPGLPANREIYIDSDKMVRWESEYLDTGRIIRSRAYRCTVAPVLDGPNVKSESSWSYCQNEVWGPKDSSKYPAEKMMLRVSNPEKQKGYLAHTLYGEAQFFHSMHEVYIPLQSDRLVRVGLSDNTTSFVRNLLRNFELLRNVTGLNLTFLPEQSDDVLHFQVNGSQVMVFADSADRTNLWNTGFWITGVVRGMLTLRPNVNGSQLYETEGQTKFSFSHLFPLEKTKILVGAYIGTLVPVFFIVAFTAGIVSAHIIACIFLRSPPGGTWELLQAHRRDHGDRVLAGPPG